VDLVMVKSTFGRWLSVASWTAGTLRVEMDLANMRLHHELAKASKEAADKGMSLPEPGVDAGRYGPGACPPPIFKSRQGVEPKNRVSFLAGLLPFMGHQELHDRISYQNNWRD